MVSEPDEKRKGYAADQCEVCRLRVKKQIVTLIIALLDESLKL